MNGSEIHCGTNVALLVFLIERLAQTVEQVCRGFDVIRLPFQLARRGSLGGKFTFPARDHNARYTIAENRDRSSPHIHQLIDCEQ